MGVVEMDETGRYVHFIWNGGEDLEMVGGGGGGPKTFKILNYKKQFFN